MCGIVGYVGARDALPFLMAGLERLEYRGYDSAGIAIRTELGTLEVRKEAGKLSRLATALADDRPAGAPGIGHTRWATHGVPSTPNAHPQTDCLDRFAVVHNGIIENHAALRAELLAAGHRFASDTDTEVIAHLVEAAWQDGAANGAAGLDPAEALARAVRAALARLEGAYAVAVVAAEAPAVLVAARHFSPLVVGLGEGEQLLASDIPPLLGHTRRILALEDGDVAVLTPAGARVTDLAGTVQDRRPFTVDWDAAAAEKGGYDTFVRKELDEQPTALADTLRGRLAGDAIRLPELDDLDLGTIRRVVLVAAGTSTYAGLVAKLQLERWARLPAEVAIASELRYGDPVLGPDVLAVFISQSGETADTLAALRSARAAGAPTLALTNVMGSSITRAAERTLYLQVGPEIGVVATKSFTGQLALLALLAAALGLRRGTFEPAEAAAVGHALRTVPELIAHVLAADEAVARVARAEAGARSMFFLGRGFGYPVALEAALKLKEISYIHAEAYPAGELKHGPIAMLDPSVPVFAVATASPTYDKLLSNLQEVRAREARVIALATEGDERIGQVADQVLYVPPVREELMPLVAVVPAQLFAYHVAVALGRDVDQPRNLAKSVTVE
jgi:glucosamine--fructose-6-phosphate aminotransferase (isomerizing)